MANLVTAQQVRDVSGAPTTLIDDTQMDRVIAERQKEALNHWAIYITPTKVLEIRDGNGKNQIRVNRPYIWKLLNLQVRLADSQANTFDIEDTAIDPKSSLITLRTATGNSYLGGAYFYQYPNSVRMKYLSAFMEKTVTITETTADEVAGTSVVIAVDDETGFAVGNWVLIEGLDGNREAAKITATGTDEITVDQLVQTHETDSVVTKLQTEESLTQYILYASAVTVAINAVGGTYTLLTGWSMEGVTAQVGVPWTHWQNSFQDNDKRRLEAKNKVHTKLNAIG